MQYSKAEQLVYRLLWLDLPQPEATPPSETTKAERAFGLSVAFTGIRCILQYAVLPFILPIFGIAGNAAVPVVLVINVIAIVAVVTTLRRLWRISYQYRWQYLVVGVVSLIIQAAFLLFDVVKPT